jgi:hypothetical protein
MPRHELEALKAQHLSARAKTMDIRSEMDKPTEAILRKIE